MNQTKGFEEVIDLLEKSTATVKTGRGINCLKGTVTSFRHGVYQNPINICVQNSCDTGGEQEASPPPLLQYETGTESMWQVTGKKREIFLLDSGSFFSGKGIRVQTTCPSP